MHKDAKGLAALIERMASTAREHSMSRQDKGWWVVLCGNTLDPHDFDQREHMREMLSSAAKKLGLTLNEHVWVWDEQDRAQLVVGRYRFWGQAVEESERLARQIRTLGMSMVVRVMAELEEGRD